MAKLIGDRYDLKAMKCRFCGCAFLIGMSVVGQHAQACHQCLERFGGGFLSIRIPEISQGSMRNMEYLIPYYVLAFRNVLTEKHVNNKNTSLIQIAKKYPNNVSKHILVSLRR